MSTARLPDGLVAKRRLNAEEAPEPVWLVDRAGESAVLRLGASSLGELAVAGRVEDPALLRPTDWGTLDDGTPWVVRPWVAGTTFDEALAAGVSDERVIDWLRQLLRVLGRLHAAGFVHRDVKAGNVLVGDDDRVHLIDLQLAAPVGGRGGGGAPGHVAPEVLLGQPVGPAADLFSVGAMLALAGAGQLPKDFHERFPRESFWEAGGLDPARLPEAWRDLVVDLLHRQPRDRPGSAAEAARRLPGGAAAPTPPGMPFLEGRHRLLGDLAERAARPGRATIVAVPPEEAFDLADALELALTLEGHPVTRGAVTGTATLDLLEPLDPRGAEDALLAFAVDPDRARRGLLVLLDPAEAREVADRVEAELEPDERRALSRAAWSDPSEAAVVARLRELTPGTSPQVVERLGRSLHRAAGGRRRELDRLLREAEADGVWRAEGGSWVPVLESWPTPADGSRDELAAEDDDARAVLAALGVLAEAGDAAGAGALAEVAGLPLDRALAALASLEREGLARPAAGAPSCWTATRAAPAAAALAALADEPRRGLQRRAVSRLETVAAPPESVLPLRLRAAGDDEADEREALAGEVLAHAAALRASGRLPAARALLACLDDDAVAGRHAAARDLVAARLDLAQGAVSRATERLHARFGRELAEADTEGLVVAAVAEEQAGHREQAAALRKRAREAGPGPALARELDVVDAYALHLDGRPGDVLERIAGPDGADTPVEVRVAAHHLRGAAHTARGDLDAARAEYAAGIEVARSAGDLLGLAKGETNRAHLERRAGDTAAALAGLHRALAAFDRAGHLHGRGRVLNNLGVLQRDLGDLTQARALFEEALALRRRLRDHRGAIETFGNLALADLDAGAAGRALERIDRAGALMRRAGFGATARTLAWQQVAALALAGRHVEAATLAEGLDADAAPDRVLARRALALLAWSHGDTAAAAEHVEHGLAFARESERPGECYRLAALGRVLAPHDAATGAALESAAVAVDGPVRRAETAWRLLGPDATPDEATLREALAVFDGAGRTDLVHVVSRRLAAGVEDPVARRRFAARAAEAAEVLGAGLEAFERRRVLERVASLAGGPPAASITGPGLEWMASTVRRLAAEDDLEGLLGAIVDLALEITGARRGLLVLVGADAPEVAVARGPGHAELTVEQARFSRTIVSRALEQGRALITTDAGADDRFAGTASIDELHLRSILCLPFSATDGARGALLLDDDAHHAAFDDGDTERIALLADQAALAIGQLRRRREIERLNARLAERLESQGEELERTRRLLRRQGAVAPVAGIVGESEAMLSVFGLIDRLGPTELPVLVTGPSGTGKDLVARALHARSRRADGPLVIENVAALPAPLLESELFGHARGAFTGADRDRPGLFAEADGGTFVLDEIGEMPIELQSKLLRVLESGEFRPVGSRRTQRADVRIVACTNRDLLQRVDDGAFREDLFYRLNAAEIRLPSLEERLDDVPLLVQHVLDRLNQQHGTSKPVTEEVVAALIARRWPGQVRELANEVARLYFLGGDVLDAPELVRDAASRRDGVMAMPDSLRLEDAERAAIARALEASGGRKDRAARLLGISRAGLYAKLKRLEPGGDD